MIKVLYCNICKREGTIRPSKVGEGVRLVRDHNHVSKEIRGILCEQCNTFLGSYESGYRTDRTKYKKWVEQYEEQIQKHLQGHTGIRYHGRKYDKNTFEEVFGQ